MLRTQYALDGKPLAGKHSLARLYEISIEQIDNLRARALRRLRYQSLIDDFEDLVVQVATDVLDGERNK